MKMSEDILHPYYREKRRKLATSIARQIRVYLDTNYWIYFCELRLGRKVPDGCRELYQKLESMVDSGTCVCPVGQETLIEVMKQSDPVTLTATAEVIDRLSVSLRSACANSTLR